MTQSIEVLAEKRRKWVEANRENGFDEGLKCLLTDLYPDNAHFIYELLQNAEDAQAQEVKFTLRNKQIQFEHDGKKCFSFEDVDAITSIGFSTKRDDTTTIGKFGVGFKAVFAYTNTPKIESGKFCFQISDMVLPRDCSSGLALTSKVTRFTLPFNNPKKPHTQARIEIEKLLKDLDATTLLFLTHIRKIEYFLPDSTQGCIERIEHGGSRLEIRVRYKNKSTSLSTWFLKFEKEVQVTDQESEREAPIEKNCRIAVAFKMSPAETATDTKKRDIANVKAKFAEEIVPIEPGSVCIYFPADKETSNLRFHLHAPFASTVARDSVRDCAGNDALRNHLADLLAESIHKIRDQGLLSVHSLALLPNATDNLMEFYKPLMVRLIQEFKEEDLVPMKRGGYAAASGVFRGPKVLSDLIGDDDLSMLLGGRYHVPLWVSNPPQRHQREDNFLSMLGINQWGTAELVEVLSKMNAEDQVKWLGSKDDKWHQNLYEILGGYLNPITKSTSEEEKERKNRVACLSLVRCNDGTYHKGCECYFPVDDVEHGDEFLRVTKGVYISGTEENKKVREFLEQIGVREVDEKIEIEFLLKTRYSPESVSKKEFNPDINHIKQFIDFFQKHHPPVEMFQKFHIFKLECGSWDFPGCVYLDEPFMDTGLGSWFAEFEDAKKKNALSNEYQNCGINPEAIGDFAKKLGACTNLKVETTKVSKHPQARLFFRCRFDRHTKQGKNIDYHIPGLLDFLATPSIKKSGLIWHTMKESSEHGCEYLTAEYGTNGSNIITQKSTLVHNLREAKWVPQKRGEQIEYVQPCDALAEELPEGFTYQTGWQWLLDLEFGERRESKGHTQQSRAADYKLREEVVKNMGFESLEEAEKIAKLKKDNPEGYNKFIEGKSACKQHPLFPTRPVGNLERRQEHLDGQISDAPKKEYEKRERSVRTTNGAIDSTTWLRNQYKNEDDQMVCQICKEEMPFRKRNGEHYFEKKEVLSREYLPKEHEAQYLALCPLCAAMYEEFVKNDKVAMADLKDKLVNTEDCSVSITLDNLETSIRFVEKHLHDLRRILAEVE